MIFGDYVGKKIFDGVGLFEIFGVIILVSKDYVE